MGNTQGYGVLLSVCLVYLNYITALGQAKYLGLVRNFTRLGLLCIAYNLKRGAAIQRDLQTR